MSTARLLVTGCVVLALVAWETAGAQRPVPRPVAHPTAATSGQPQAQWKGIWEPVNYGEDINLNSAYFVTVDEGWVAGGAPVGHGVLLHTVDGGDHWDVVLGDPAGTQAPFSDLQFVDRKTGFVVQKTSLGDHALLHTTDGVRWSVSGTVPQHRQDYRFLSTTVGVAATGTEIRRTTDAGRSWKKVFDCTLKVTVQGLTRAISCEAAAFAFPTATVGYAIGHSSNAPGLFVLRTEDAGVSWSVALAVPDANGREGHVFFTNEQAGYICTADGRLFGTADAGKTWDGLAGAQCESKAPMLFADPEVGWTLYYRKLTYTTDGGQRWVSRDIAFPAAAKAFSLPRRDRAYAVGDHGMVYRYRVVPASATMPATDIAAPAMPGLPTALATNMVQLQNEVSVLDSGLATFVDPGSGTGSAAAPSAPGGFAQDVMSPFMSKCCAKRASLLKEVLTAIGTIVPEFTSKYRNLNLLTQGLRTAVALPDATASLKAAFVAFHAAGDKSSALNALAQVKSVFAMLRAAADTALQKPVFTQ